MRWTVHSERTLYDSPWVRLTLLDVELPGGERLDYHVVRMPNPAAATVVHDPDRGVLLLWRHRVILDAWGWEVPGGEVDAGESPEDGAVREAVEETGWRPGPLRQLGTYYPLPGRSDHAFHVFVADGAELVGAPVDSHEAERIEWLPVEEVRQLLGAGSVIDGYSATALALAFALGELD